MSSKEIALLGIFRSGTNYTRTVLEWNYDCRLVNNIYGWKHGFIPIVDNQSRQERIKAPLVFVTKNPFSALRSLYKYYKNTNRNILAEKGWRNFLRGRIVTYDFFQPDSPQYRFANPIDYWNSMNWNFASGLSGKGSLCMHVRYEDILQDPLTCSRQVSKYFDLNETFTKDSHFRCPDFVVRNMGDDERDDREKYVTDRRFNPSPYRTGVYFDVFDKDDIAFVVEHLDMQLVEKLGYLEVVHDATKKSG